jgi:hypothetical protein
MSEQKKGLCAASIGQIRRRLLFDLANFRQHIMAKRTENRVNYTLSDRVLTERPPGRLCMYAAAARPAQLNVQPVRI